MLTVYVSIGNRKQKPDTRIKVWGFVDPAIHVDLDVVAL